MAIIATKNFFTTMLSMYENQLILVQKHQAPPQAHCQQSTGFALGNAKIPQVNQLDKLAKQIQNQCQEILFNLHLFAPRFTLKS